MKKFCITLLCFFNVATQATEKWPQSVDVYAKLLQQVRSSKHVSVEQAYEKGMEAINALGDALGNDESEIDPKWLKSVRAKMEGFELNPNTETYVANPKPQFFLTLAKKSETQEDIAFFELIIKTEPDGRWPLYIEQRTDLSGCTIYNGKLTKLHRDWSDFQRKYPNAFNKRVKAYLDDIENHLTESRCSCSEKAEPILNELQSFVQSNPNLALTKKIQIRIKDIKAKKAPIPGCKSEN